MSDMWEHLSSGDFMPHGHCYLWLPEILWTNVGSDFVIAMAYFSIPVSIVAFVRKRQDVDFKMVPVLFSAFIFLCGATHLFAIFTVWNGYYGYAGLLKAATAIVSIFTAIWVWKLLPDALAIPSNRQMQAIVSNATSELVDKNRELGRANAEVESFVSAASHDLKEPLRTLVAYSQLLEKDAGDKLNDDAKRDLEHIVDGAKRMQMLVNDILDLSRTGSDETNFESVELEKIVRDVIETMEARIQSTGAQIEVDDLPVVIGDRVLLRHIFTNLITNAIKFARDNTTPVVRVYVDASGKAPVYCVSDNGIGIEAEYVEQIFEPFRRLHGRDHSEGTGIGLAICKRAVERHDGDIWVVPGDGGGTTFKFTLGIEEHEIST